MSEIKVNDWVHVKILGISEDLYQVKKIDGDKYTVIYKDGSYTHTLVVVKSKLKKM